MLTLCLVGLDTVLCGNEEEGMLKIMEVGSVGR